MTKESLAERLDGREYNNEITPEEERLAKQSGLVVIFGASDDLMEFRGAIYDELGAWQGKQARVDSEGLVPEFDDIEKEAYDAKDKLREYFRRENSGKVIEALWCGEADYSWTFRTDIPHATFEITEDGEKYCRGIVFALKDTAK